MQNQSKPKFIIYFVENNNNRRNKDQINNIFEKKKKNSCQPKMNFATEVKLERNLRFK